MPIEGASELRAVSVRLKEAGLVDLRKEMNKKIRVATLPARPAIRASALATLPKRGGLNAYVAQATTTTSVLTGLKTAGVVVRVKRRNRRTGKPNDMKDMDAGDIRHMVFGNPRVWAAQSVPAGFATKPMQKLAPAVGAACVVAMRETAAAAGFH